MSSPHTHPKCLEAMALGLRQQFDYISLSLSVARVAQWARRKLGTPEDPGSNPGSVKIFIFLAFRGVGLLWLSFPSKRGQSCVIPLSIPSQNQESGGVL